MPVYPAFLPVIIGDERTDAYEEDDHRREGGSKSPIGWISQLVAGQQIIVFLFRGERAEGPHMGFLKSRDTNIFLTILNMLY